MHLATMVRLVVKEMQHCDRRCVHAILAPAIGVPHRPGEKVIIGFFKERFDTRVFLPSRSAKFNQVLEQNSIQWRCRITATSKPRHPNPIAKQYMVQQTMDAAERTTALASVLSKLELAALFVYPLIRASIVASKHPESIQHNSIDRRVSDGR